MARRERFHAGPVVVHPVEPLSQPFVVWDARMWNGMTNEAIIPNLGSAGSALDLVVTAASSDPVNRMAAAVTVAGDWDLVGGPPCDGPFTIMVCLEWERRPGGLPSNFAQLGNIGLWWPSRAVNAANLEGGQTPRITLGPAGAGEITAPSNTAASSINSRFKTLTLDPVDGGSTYWLGTTATNPTTRSGSPGACSNAEDAEAGNIIGRGLGLRGFSSLPQDGLGWIGYAMFRGEPTPQDIDYWKTYFNTPLPPDPFLYEVTSVHDTPAPGTAFTVRRSWYDATYCYHWIESQVNATDNVFKTVTVRPIPAATLPATIDFILVGAGQNVAGRNSPRPSNSGGGGGGQVIQVSGHPAPTTATDFTLGGFNNAGDAKFEGFTANGKNSGTTFQFVGPNGGISLDGVNAGGVGGQAGQGAGGGGAGGAGQSFASGSNGGAGILSNWHWSATNQAHGGGGPGQRAMPAASVPSTYGAWANEPRGLGWGARGTSWTTGPARLSAGGPAGLIIRYAY